MSKTTSKSEPINKEVSPTATEPVKATAAKPKKQATKQTKARYWDSVLYPENMITNWEERIDDKFQVPYVYCQHDGYTTADGKVRKTHIHVMVCFNSATTYNNALNLFNSLAADGKQACNKCEPVHNIKNVYDYFIHDTDKARADGKTPYPPEARICGNGFDIRNYVQASKEDKKIIKNRLMHLIIDEGYEDYTTFMIAVDKRGDPEELDIAQKNYAFFTSLTRGNYQRAVRKREGRVLFSKYYDGKKDECETVDEFDL